MYLEWTAHLPTQEERDNFKRTVLAARPVLERLTTILDKKEKELERVELSPEAFDNPNWAYRQAYRNGFKKCLMGLKEITNLDQQIIKDFK